MVMGVLGSLLNYVRPVAVADGLDVLRAAHHQLTLCTLKGGSQWSPPLSVSVYVANQKG